MPTARRVRGKYAAPQDSWFAAAPLAAEDGGYQNWKRRTSAIRTGNAGWRLSELATLPGVIDELR